MPWSTYVELIRNQQNRKLANGTPVRVTGPPPSYIEELERVRALSPREPRFENLTKDEHTRAHGHTVVTQELSQPDKRKEVPIPDATLKIGKIKTVTIYELLRAMHAPPSSSVHEVVRPEPRRIRRPC